MTQKLDKLVAGLRLEIAKFQEEVSRLRIQRDLYAEEVETLRAREKEHQEAVTRYTERLADLLQKRFPKEEKETGKQDPERAEKLRKIAG